MKYELFPLISVIIPCHNESDNIKPLYADLYKTLLESNYTYEFIFVDDGSTDDTLKKIAKLKGNRTFTIKTICLARNFGKEIATTAGLHAAEGEAAIIIDADLQHPPSIIPELLYKWRDGADIVIGVRDSNSEFAGRIKRAGSAIFYKIMQRITDMEIVPGSTDFRLLDRNVVNEFNRFTERSRLTRGLIDWLGYKREYVTFTPASRQHGEASYSTKRLINLALNSFVTMSMLPLKLTGYIGIFITLLSGLAGVVIVVAKYIFNTPWGMSVTGTASLATLIVFLIGIVMASLGLIALYIASIHIEVMNRPLYVVRKPRNQEGAPLLNVTKDMIVEHDQEA